MSKEASNRDPDALVREIEERHGYIFPWQAHLAREDSTFMESYEQMWAAIVKRSVVLEPRVKQLILLAVVAALRDESVLEVQMRRALNEGITSREITEALEVAFLPAGGLALRRGVTTLVDVLEETRR